ncbi:hypothetical protein SELMODRAFT_404241 [Selaginella moellendorffii]|uniref:Uncharacterized protein n=1 Tax=Selaginella moellendorffii TaxID=88036 RepID=D8QUQ5_SELML|nr:hypothetical protein SELMODRAFT_404241 [Selaginella moellendorffii]
MEPGGTEGRPIYAAIENSGVDGVMVVVTRYKTIIYFGMVAGVQGGNTEEQQEVAMRQWKLKEVASNLSKTMKSSSEPVKKNNDAIGTSLLCLDFHSYNRLYFL